MSAGSDWNVSTKFGSSDGPTYEGKTTVPANPATGNNDVQIDKVVDHAPSGETTISADPVTKANVLGLGFLAKVTSLNGNSGTPAVTILLKGAGVGGADLSLPLAGGEAVAFTDNTFMTGDATSITCVADTISDFEILGTVHVTV